MAVGESLNITGNLILDILKKRTTNDLLYTFLILLVGFLLAKASTRIIHIIYRAFRGKESLNLHAEKEPFFKAIKYVIMTSTIIMALVYLKVSVVEHLLVTYEILPRIISVILVIVLGITVIEFVVYLLKVLFRSVGVVEYLELYNVGHVLDVIVVIVKIILHLVLLEILLRMFGFDFTPFTSFLLLVFYGGIILLVLFSFVGSKWFVENLFAGSYLKSLHMFKEGRHIEYKGYKGEIVGISRASTTIKTGKKILLVPNKQLASHELLFDEVKPSLKTLPEIKKYFTEQRPSYCGPASTQIILSIFGYKFDQIKIGEMCKTQVGIGTHPQTLIKVTEKLTRHKVRGAWIGYDRIHDLKQEIRAWLSQGALIIVDYKKDFLFPTAKKAHYSVCIGIEGSELLIIDPSSKTGGVYYVDINRVFKGMNTYSPLIKGKRGYIVFAPKGTNGFWRIQNKLVFSDMTLYKDLSKQVREKFARITRRTLLIKSILPKSVKRFIDNWESKEKVFRVWKS